MSHQQGPFNIERGLTMRSEVGFRGALRESKERSRQDKRMCTMISGGLSRLFSSRNSQLEDIPIIVVVVVAKVVSPCLR